MSNSWWVNNIGTATAATTPAGGVPQYGLGFQLGTADGWNSDTFSTFVEDQVKRTNSAQIQQLELQQRRDALIAQYGQTGPFGMTRSDLYDENGDHKSTFKIGLSAVGHIAGSIFGEFHSRVEGGDDAAFENAREALEAQGIDKATWDKFAPDARSYLLGKINGGEIIETPGFKQAIELGNAAWDVTSQALGTMPMMARNTLRGEKMFWEPGSFGAAWRAAEDRTPAESFLDATFMVGKSDADLDRIRRTNNLYQMTAFGGDLAISFVADPGVVAGKGLGTLRSIKAGELPRAGTKGAAEALRVLQAEDPSVLTPEGGLNARVGFYRGQRMVRTFSELRQAAKEMDITDFQNLPMFRRKATSGGDLAYAFHYAAQDDRLWDLTRRAAFADPAAWQEIRAMKMGQQEILGKYQGTNPQTYLDALDAAKTNEKRLQAEVNDLQRAINSRNRFSSTKLPADGVNNPGPDNRGIHRHYTWELDRELKDKQADLTDLQDRLAKYEDYQTWLETAAPEGSLVNRLESVSARPDRLNFLSTRTYKAGPYGAAHTVRGISRAGMVREANPIELHRVSSGTESILRQFEGLHQNLNYVDREGLNEALTKWGRARDEFERFQVAREIEDTHLPRALAGYFGLEEDTVRMFMDKIRERKDTMINALLSGENSVYGTAGESVARGVDTVKILERKDGYARILVADGDKMEEMFVPEFALESQAMPVDPTQTPNTYIPLNSRQLKLAIKHDHDLFKELESARRNRGRQAAGLIMDSIDEFGGRWNRFWKPLQLFRLGWPQRVLMDETLRGLVRLGMGPTIKSYGKAYTLAGINAITQPLAWQREKRAFLKAGPGPLTRKDYDVASLDEVQDASPVIPERFEPVVNPTRLSKLDEQIAANTAVWRHNSKRRALIHEIQRVDHPDVHYRVDRNLDAQEAVYDSEGPYNKIPGYDHPILAAILSIATDAVNVRKTTPKVARAIDPITGQTLHNGYAVPFQSYQFQRLSPHGQDNLAHWIEQNRELLASNNMRVVVEAGDSTAHVHVVRVFKNTQAKDAADFAHYVGNDKMWNIRKGNAEELVREWDDTSPVERYVRRPTFVGEEETALQPGKSPAKGVPPVYHGTYGSLPEDLMGRDQAPVETGRMVGAGFYTTVDFDMARSYGADDPTRVYTIRGSKSRKTYKVFDLEQHITDQDLDELARFIAEHEFQRPIDPSTFNMEDHVGYVRDRLRSLTFNRFAPSNETSIKTWIQTFQDLEYDQWQKYLTQFLEERRGAGALTHVGGVMTGGRRHQVYVWLNPEDLMVRPAYAKTGKFHLLEDWLQSNMAREDIPESQIHRVGPKPRALKRQAEASEAREASLQSGRLTDVEGNALDPDLDFSSWDDPHEEFLRRLLKKREFGKGQNTFKAPNGEKVYYDKPFEGAGEIYMSLLSSSPAYSKLTDRYKRTLTAYRQRAVGYKRIAPPPVDEATLRTRGGMQKAKEYYTYWADMLNQQVRNSPIWFKMLEGQTDDEIVAWLRNTPEGAKIRASLPHKGQRPEDWVDEHRFQLNVYLPDRNMQRQLAKQKVRPTDLRRIPDGDRPDVAAEDLEMISGSGIGAMFGRTVEKIYHALGTVPTDVLNRQPFFAGMYDLKMKNLIAAHINGGKGKLDNEVLKAYEKGAREFALKQVRKTMFDLADDTNMSQALRFIAPFWGAQSEALEKWFRIFVDKPETVARFYAGSRVVYDRLQVINEDGEPVDEPRSKYGYNPEDRIVLQIPENLKKIAPFDKMLKDFGSVDFSIGSLNTSIQGENPVLPSLGPMVVVPANALVNAMWDTHATEFDENFFYKWLFPVGRASGNPLDQLIDQTAPGWAKRAYAQLTGTESRMYNSVYWSVYREMELNNKEKGLPPPTPNEVADAVRWHMGLRTVGSFGLPVQLNFRPKHQFFLDEYHRMIKEYGPGPAFEEFVKKYGVDAAYFASASSSSVGVPSTSEGMAEWSKARGMIQKYPEWADAIISPDAWADDFSSDAYDQQFDIKLGPGTNQTLREVTSPTERQRLTDVRTGWLEFRQFSSAIDAELAARGLTSTAQKGAEDLAQLKRSMVVDLVMRNAAWAEDYDTLSNSINERVNELKNIATNPMFDTRPEWQGVRQYLTIRDQAVNILESVAAQGGSRNLQAQDNAEIAQWFYTQVGSLVLANPAFGEFYNRWLTTDRLEGRASQL